MAFMAALPSLASLGSTAVGLGGALLGGKGEDTGQNIRNFDNQQSALQQAVGLNQFALGQQQLNQYDQLLAELTNQWRQQSGAQWDQMQSAERRYGPVEDAQAQAILQDMSLYQPYKQASVQTGLNALDSINQALALRNETAGSQRLANQDVEQALRMGMDTYRPMEQRMLGRLESDAVPAAQQAWGAAQDYFTKMKEGIDPNTWANQAAGDVSNQFGAQRAAMGRNRAAMGIDPSSGVAQAADLDMAVNEALQGAGASSKARQAGVLQNLQNYGVGLNALQSGAGQFANTLNGVTGTVQKGPTSFGLPIFQNTANFNPATAKSMMMEPASNLTAGALMKQFQSNPNNMNGLIGQLGSMSQSNMNQLYNAIGNSKLNQQQSQPDTSGAGYGALAGYGLSGLTNSKSMSGLSGLFGGGGSSFVSDPGGVKAYNSGSLGPGPLENWMMSGT
jgi:hypothetical protein